MVFSNDRRSNLGCLASALIGAVALPTIFGGLMFGGGGCEGRPSSCQPDYTHIWIIMGSLVVGLAALAWLINRAIAAIIAFWTWPTMPTRRKDVEHQP